MKHAHKHSLILAATLLLPLGTALADEGSEAAADAEISSEQRLSDAWIAGKLEAVYALNSLEIGSGDASAAEAEAESERPAQSASGGGRKFGAWVDDTTTTAAVKSKLISNGNVAARNIDVTTRYDVVTLTGIVSSEQEKQLAAEIALNTADVSEVRNDLTVK